MFRSLERSSPPHDAQRPDRPYGCTQQFASGRPPLSSSIGSASGPEHAFYALYNIIVIQQLPTSRGSTAGLDGFNQPCIVVEHAINSFLEQF
jgi:hypothetical protein